MEPEFLVDTTCDKCSKGKDRGGFTLAVLFSRIWALKPFFSTFEKLEIPMDDCHLLIVDNTDMVPLGKALKFICENYVGYFRSVRLYKTYREGGKVIMHGIHTKCYESKLPPIILGYLDIGKLTTTETLINIEDDTLVPKHGIMKLLDNYETLGPKVFISGVECNRGDDPNVPTRLGVYWIRCKNEKLVERVSLSPKCKGVKSVDACGHYFFITTKELFTSGFINMYRFLNKSTHFAPDTYHTYNLHSKGVRILADFDIPCVHMHPTPLRILKWTPGKAISTLDYYIKKWDTWANPTGLKCHVTKKPRGW